MDPFTENSLMYYTHTNKIPLARRDLVDYGTTPCNIDDDLKILTKDLNMKNLLLNWTEKNEEDLLELVNGDRKALTVLSKEAFMNLSYETMQFNFQLVHGFLISLLLYSGFNDYPFQLMHNYELKVESSKGEIQTNIDYLIKYNDKEVCLIFLHKDSSSPQKKYFPQVLWKSLVASLSVSLKNKKKSDKSDIVMYDIFVYARSFIFLSTSISSTFADEYLTDRNITSYMECSPTFESTQHLHLQKNGDREKILSHLSNIRRSVKE